MNNSKKLSLFRDPSESDSIGFTDVPVEIASRAVKMKSIDASSMPRLQLNREVVANLNTGVSNKEINCPTLSIFGRSCWNDTPNFPSICRVSRGCGGTATQNPNTLGNC